jgi:CubicO group peptidase (beta-lactamase class C family)
VLDERVLGPLGMADTGFSVPPGKLDRLTTLYMPDDASGWLEVFDEPATSWWSTPPAWPDASGWLVSTIDDYWTFVSMLLAGGAGPDGTRVLAPETVELMLTDRLTTGQRAAQPVFLGDDLGWGLGLAVPAAGSADRPVPCGIGWDGGTGTTWRSNRSAGVTGILLTQRHVTSPEPTELVDAFWAGVAAATRR